MKFPFCAYKVTGGFPLPLAAFGQVQKVRYSTVVVSPSQALCRRRNHYRDLLRKLCRRLLSAALYRLRSNRGRKRGRVYSAIGSRLGRQLERHNTSRGFTLGIADSDTGEIRV